MAGASSSKDMGTLIQLYAFKVKLEKKKKVKLNHGRVERMPNLQSEAPMFEAWCLARENEGISVQPAVCPCKNQKTCMYGFPQDLAFNKYSALLLLNGWESGVKG